MVKSLFDKVKEVVIAGTIATIVSLGFASCDPYITEPTDTPTEKPAKTGNPTENPTEQPSAVPTATPAPNYFDIEGNIVDAETGIRKEGNVRIYDVNDPKVIAGNYGDAELLGETHTDSEGNFSVSLDKTVEELSEGVVVRGCIGSGNWESSESYTRTVNCETKSSDLEVACVSYPNFDANNDGNIDVVDYENFRDSMEEINMSTWIRGDGKEVGMGITTARNVEILQENYKGESYGKFTSAKQNFIQNKIEDPNDIRKYIKGEGIYVQVDGDNNSHEDGNHYTISSNGQDIYPDEGWIIVYPDDDVSGLAATTMYYNESAFTGEYNRGKIAVYAVNDAVISHEFGHVYIAQRGHATAVENTIMNAYPDFPIPQEADEKAGNIIYSGKYLPRETLGDTFGINQ